MATKVLAVVGVFALAALFFFVWVWFFKIAWNYVIPQMFGLPYITYWQSLALAFLLGTIGKGINIASKKD